MQNRCFNITGPCLSGEHYMLDPMRGVEDDLMSLINKKLYFVIHAARQTGKTTLLQNLVSRINAAGNYYAIYCSLETLYNVEDPKDGIPGIIDRLGMAFQSYNMPAEFASNIDREKHLTILMGSLQSYCQKLDKPLVILFDEADCLSENTLISFLRQLRDGYNSRGITPFVHSIALVGMRNIRDYKVKIRPDSATLGTSSPFNIIRESINLRNFTHGEVGELYAQHTAQTGQVFEQEMIDYVFEQTQGQPWLVNAIACESVEKIAKKDYTIIITKAHAEQAIQNIVRDRKTHIDSIMDKLRDKRVRNILVPMILGESIYCKSGKDYSLVRDLGLIKEENGKTIPANPIYADIFAKVLITN